MTLMLIGKLSNYYSSFSVMLWFKLSYTHFLYLFAVGFTLPCTSGSWHQHHESSLVRQSKCVCVFRAWGLLVASCLCLSFSKARSLSLIAGIFSSPWFAFGHIYMFVNAICISAVFTCPFCIHLQFYLISTVAISGTYLILDACSLLFLNPVLLSSQGCNLLVTRNWPLMSCDF